MRADRLVAAAIAALALASCSGDEDKAATAPIRLQLTDARPAPDEIAMPGKIDPPDGRWVRTGEGAVYGEPGMPALLKLSCENGSVRAIRNVPSEDGAKAMLSFVGYRGILRLPVSNDGDKWAGALASDDPHWIALTGGPFYATVAGGGKVIFPASSTLSELVDGCKTRLAKGAERDSA